MDLAFLSQVDGLTLQLELARAAFETAKSQFEAAKLAHEDLLSQSESRGLPKAKVKKLADERVQALIEGGLVDRCLDPAPKKERAPRKAKSAEPDLAEDFPHATSAPGAELAAAQ